MGTATRFAFRPCGLAVCPRLGWTRHGACQYEVRIAPPLAAHPPFMASPIDVAVAIFMRPDGSVLLAERPAGKVYADYWEFPGGKVEPGESVAAALAREIDEELGVCIERAFPWITQVFTYPHATVRLHFFRVTAWQGEPRAVEHKGLSWERPEAIRVAPLLPANGPVLKGLLLPDEYAITQAAEVGIEEFLARLKRRLTEGLRLVQVREKHLDRDALAAFARRVVALAKPFGAAVLINGDAALAAEVGADGVHLTSAQVATLSVRPAQAWVGASCHTAGDLRAAEKLGVDFAVLGPVLATPTHPDAQPMDWEGFESLAKGALIPVYALGGVTCAMLDEARLRGAHGIAMLRGSWAEARR